MALPCDLRSLEQIDALFEAVREAWGGVDVLVNNAGLGRVAPLLSGDAERWRELLDVNVLALCVCTREAVADMRRRGDRGFVIHISSMSGHRVSPDGGVYAATKHAVRALTEALRLELRAADSGVRVSSISPGNVETEFLTAMFGDAAAEVRPPYKVLEAADVAAAVRYALSQPPWVQVHDVLLRPREQDR